MQLPDRPADVDVGRDSTCALPRDSMLPPPTDENTKEMLRQSVTGSARGSILNFEDERPATAPSHAAFSDCQEWLTGPADSPCKGAVDVVKRAQRMETEEELEGETGDDAAQEVEAMQQRIEAAALTVANMTSYVLQQVGEGDADVSDVVHGSGLHEESEGADTPQDALSLALTELKSALEQRQCADAEARTRAQQQEQEQQEQRSEEQASLRAEQEQVARLQDEVKALQQQLLEAQEAQTQVGVKAQEVKDLQAALEEEKELAKMRSRRLRGGIRAVQGQLAGVRGGFDELRAQVKDMTDSILPDLSSMAGKLETSILGVAAGIQTELDETNGKFEGEVKERKRLHNLVQELKGNIRVFARIRPISAREKEASRKSVALCTSDSEMSLCAGGKLSMYNFDRVFGQDSTQEEVFEETGPLVVSVLDGYNVCIFAYGQTGSGKTHTMEGSEAMRGVNYRSLSMLFQLAHDRRMIAKYEFKVSLLEIYNEQIKDLIELHDAKGDLKKLEVKNDPNGGTFVTDLKTSPVESIEDVLQVMSMGMRNRSTSSTNMNNQSSRSHCIFSVHVTCTDLLKGGTSFGKMHLVDLAGSERLSRTGAEGDRLTEAKNINKSLSALGNCISSLVSKSKHTPFRDSKLTHFLQDSLGGEAKMLMFVCASPCDADVQESKCSLEFATRVGTVELGSAKRRGDGGASAALKEMQTMLQTTKEEASKAGGEKERLLEELERIKEEAASKHLEAESALKSLRGKERELSEKDKAVAASKAQLAAKDKETQKLHAAIALLKQQQQQQPVRQAQPPLSHAAAACGDAVAGAEGAEKRSSIGTCAARKSSPPPDFGGIQQDVHAATMLTRRASSSFSPPAASSPAVDKLDAEDEMSASASNNIAAEAAAVAAAVAEEEATAEAATVAQEAADDLLSYLQPGGSDENEISFSEVDDKENAEGNAEARRDLSEEAAADTAKEGEGQSASGESAASRTETLEQRLEKFRKKKEENKKKLVVGTQSTPTTPSKTKGISKRDVRSDLLNSSASVAPTRLSMRPQTALSRPATAIPKPPGALSGGAVRPKSAAAKGPASDRLASRSRVDRSQRSAGWR
eukprot:Tamp_02529.p1 GENE.Tamp_02529~~Tamp_02529.p1  ORF type:complete len:1275 (+),score=451.89 Tamp_02529:552-3827(+)